MYLTIESLNFHLSKCLHSLSFIILGLLGCCCPCILGWLNAEKLGMNPLLGCVGMYCFPMVVAFRKKTREKFGIGGDILDDTIMAGPIVGQLSLCQVYNEVDARNS